MEIARIESLENINEHVEKAAREFQQHVETEEQRKSIENAGKAAIEMLSGYESLTDVVGMLKSMTERIENKELKEKFKSALKPLDK